MKLIKIIFVVVIFLSIFSCNPQKSRNTEILEMDPQILISQRYDAIAEQFYTVIIINNNFDNRPYENYEVYINGIFKAKFLRRPAINKTNGVEVPIDIFYDEFNGRKFNLNTKISSIMFEADGYKDFVIKYNEDTDYPIFSLIGPIRVQTKDQRPNAVMVDMLLQYDLDDEFALMELTARLYELRDFTRNYFRSKYSYELTPENEDKIKQEICDMLNSKIFTRAKISGVMFNQLYDMDY